MAARAEAMYIQTVERLTHVFAEVYELPIEDQINRVVAALLVPVPHDVAGVGSEPIAGLDIATLARGMNRLAVDAEGGGIARFAVFLEEKKPVAEVTPKRKKKPKS